MFHSKITSQDCIDGGLTMLMRAPGYWINEMIHMEDLAVDVYFTPHEVLEGSDQLKSDLTIFIQTFGQGLLMPYLHRLKSHAKAEATTPQMSLPGMIFFSPINSLSLTPSLANIPQLVDVDGGWLPRFPTNTRTHWQLRCWDAPLNKPRHSDARVNEGGLGGASSVVPDNPTIASSPTISSSPTVSERDDDFWNEASTVADVAEQRALTQLGASPSPEPPALSQALPKSLATQISMSGDLVPAPVISGLICGGTDCIAIISFGENTDRALADLNLDDKVIPQLCTLIVSIRNTKWETALTSSKWGLSPQEASILAKALNEDLAPGNRHKNMVGIGLSQSIITVHEVRSLICPQFKLKVYPDSPIPCFVAQSSRLFFSYPSWQLLPIFVNL